MSHVLLKNNKDCHGRLRRPRNDEKCKADTGFTLLELLVVIALIAILATIGFGIFYNQGKAKDSRRKADVDAISKAYEVNYSAGEYKLIEESDFAGNVIPQPPEGGSYYNNLAENKSSFRVCAALEGNPNPACGTPSSTCFCRDSQMGTYIASVPSPSPSAGPSGEPFVCGQNLVDSRDSQTYLTVLIGSQCWMKKNLNIGTRIDNSANQTDNSEFEKYCYGDNLANCSTYGGIYQWGEALQYSAPEGSQGICPAGWHVPTHDEWTTLERTACMQYPITSTQSYCETQFIYDGPDCSTCYSGSYGYDDKTGIKLAIGGSTGFEALYGGYSYNGYYSNEGTEIYLWTSSTALSGSRKWYRVIYNNSYYGGDYPEIERNRSLLIGNDAYFLRCLKD